MVLRWNFLHPKMFGYEINLSKVGPAQRQKLTQFLTTFLEIGRFMKLRRELKAWVKKVNVRSDEVQKRDMTKIKSWPSFIASLMVLAENAAQLEEEN